MAGRTDSVELRKRINLYFDNALNKEEEQNLMQEIRNDNDCSQIFNKEKSFRAFIKTNVKRSSVSPDLIQNIRDRIRIV